MKLKMKLMAAAVALVASAGANAAMSNFASGNGSLAFIALDSVGSPTSVMMDLDFNLTSFLSASSAANTDITWNFNTNTLTVGGLVQAGAQTNWSGALTAFNSLANTSDTKWGVIAGDSLNAVAVGSDGTPIRYLTTVVAGTALDLVDNQTKANLGSFSGVDNMLNFHSAAQAASNGSTASSGTGYVGTAFGLGTAASRGWTNRTATGVITLASEGSSADFYMLDGGSATSLATVTPYAGKFTYAAGVLTYDAPTAPIPEPETYALLLAGLGMLGFMGRRRLNNRA